MRGCADLRNGHKDVKGFMESKMFCCNMPFPLRCVLNYNYVGLCVDNLHIESFTIILLSWYIWAKAEDTSITGVLLSKICIT